MRLVIAVDEIGDDGYAVVSQKVSNRSTKTKEGDESRY